MRRLAIAVLAAIALATGCGSSSSGGTPTASGGTPTSGATSGGSYQDNAIVSIKAAWTTFFNYQTSTADRQTLLEDGSSLGDAMAIGDKFAKQQKLTETVTVKKVTLADATHASVTYDILSGGSVILPSASGIAVQVDGKWLVSKQTFCGLVELGAGGKTVPGCTS